MIPNTTSDFAVTSDGQGLQTTVEKPIMAGGAAMLGAGSMRDDIDADEREVVTFYDATDDAQVTGSVSVDRTPFVGSVNSDIYEYLRRPVKIKYFQWTTAGLNFAEDPWALLLGQVSVSRKLANFFLLRTGGLKIKIVTNGSPYQYGRYFMAYWPLAATDPMYINAAASSPARISTLPCFCTIDPSANSVVEFNIPEHQQDERAVTAAKSLGYIVGTQAALLNTVSTVTPYCDITVYAEMINPTLMYNTTNVPAYPTSKEFKGAISAPLHALSKISHKLSNVPIIGPYATATGMAAKVGASVAAALGYSRPPQVAEPGLMQRRVVGSTINAEGVDNTMVLALTKTAQVSIDPGTVGLPSEDEMVLANLLKRPSLCQVLTWNDTAVALDTVASYVNGPSLCTSTSYPIALTNLAYLTAPFAYVRGTIRYRFTFCVSKFHTGRVQIIYEPSTLVAIDPTNVTLNWVVDIAQQQEIEVEIPFGTARFFGTNIPTTLIGGAKANWGTIYVKVLNPLRCGSAVTSVNILVYNAAGPDFEVAQPTSLSLRNQTYFASWFPSAAEGAAPPAVAYENWATSAVLDSDALSINLFSERIQSLRQLSKRYMYEKPFVLPTVSTDVTYKGIRAVPNQTGYCAATGGIVRLNLEPFTFFTYFAPSFASWKGGIRKKLIQQDNSTAATIQIMPGNVSPKTFGDYAIDTYNSLTFLSGGWEGHYVAPKVAAGEAQVVEFTVPYSDRLRFYTTMSQVTNYDSGRGVVVLIKGYGDYSYTYHQYTACADDFTFFYYIGAPLVHRIAVA